MRLCSSCLELRNSDGRSIRMILDSPGYDNPVSRYLLNISILDILEKQYGCSNCINVMKRANA